MIRYKSNLAFKDVMAELKYFLIPGKYVGISYQKQYRKIFEFWKYHWTKTLREIGMELTGEGEEFCRHEEVSALFLGDRVVGVALMDYFQVKNPVHRMHKYFSTYPASVLNKIEEVALGKPVLTFGYLAIDPDFRRDYHLSDMILGLAVMRLLASSSNAMISFTRNTRRTHDLTYRLGAKAIQTDVEVRGEPSDFVYFDRNSINVVIGHAVGESILKCWKERTAVFSKNIFMRHEPNQDFTSLEHKGDTNETVNI